MYEPIVPKCDRCGRKTNSFTMSYFNKEMICMGCQAKEAQHPLYQHARDVELEEVKKGNYNFEGIGLPEDFNLQE